jgi:hypothetical protein
MYQPDPLFRVMDPRIRIRSKPKYMDAENFVLIGKKSVFRIRIRIDPHRFIVPYPLFYFTNFMFFL